MKRIVTLTMNPTIDLNTSVDHIVPERKLRCAPPRHEPGGGGINVSRALRKLGANSLALYPAGGPTGELLRMLLDSEGVRHLPILIDCTTRENVIVLEESTSQQFRFDLPGPAMTQSDWERCIEAVAKVEPHPDYLVLSGSLPPGVPPDIYVRIARMAKSWGTRCFVDTSGEALRQAAREGVFALKPNRRELCELAGHEIEDEAAQEEAATTLVREFNCELVIVSLAGAGILLVSRDERERLRAPEVPFRSAIGAGDSMVAGVVLSLARDESLRDAALMGLAAGTAAVMTPGTELCRREDTEKLLLGLRRGAGSA